MAIHTNGLHHIKKRMHKKREPYPHPDKWKGYLDRFIYAVGIMGPSWPYRRLLEFG